MRKATQRIGGIVAAAWTALTLATVGPAFASTAFASTALANTALANTAFASTAAKTMTGPEVISGSAHGKAALANVTPLPLTLAGLVATTEPGFSSAPAAATRTRS